MNDTTVIVESQLDYLRISAYRPKDAEFLSDLAHTWRIPEKARGCAVKNLPGGFYQGWRCGRIAFATKNDAAQMELSGDYADRHGAQVYALHSHVTRVDVAVTVRTAEPDPNLGDRAAAEAVAFYREHPHAARPGGNWHGDGGKTLTLGNRAADSYFRLYNKHAECLDLQDAAGAEHYVNCWRYEREHKGLLSPGVYKAWYESDDRREWCKSLMYRYVSAHGILPAFDHGTECAYVPGFRRRSDDDSRRRWYETSVAPSVRDMLTRYSHDDLAHWLGMADASGEGA